MTRKDYQLIADALAAATPILDISEPINDRNTGMIAAWVAAVNEMEWHLRNDNPRFDTDKFFRACMHHAPRCNRFVLCAGYGRLSWVPADPVQA